MVAEESGSVVYEAIYDACLKTVGAALSHR